MPRKRATTIDVAHLQKTTARNKRRRDKKRAAIAEERERQEVANAEQSGQAKAQEIISELPALLQEAARKGDDHVVVRARLYPRADKRALEIVAEYCQGLGLHTELKHYTARYDDMDSSHDYLVVSWEASGETKK